MFSDHESESSGFASNWNSSRECQDTSVQTLDLATHDKDVQTKEFSQVSVQTEQASSNNTKVSYNEDKLAAFLSRVCPAVVKELDRVSRSNAFASYALMEDSEGEVKEVTTLRLSNLEEVKVSSVSWSCTGSVLAVGLSHTLHSSWCNHPGTIHLYNVDRVSKPATRTLETASCVRSVAMHPYQPSIVAAGTSSGEVLVWDVTQEDCQPLANTSNTTHSDAVTQVRWILGTGTTVALASSALDGLLFLWKVSPQLSSYNLLERFKCAAVQGDPGISCFAFPLHQQDKFVVALEGGSVVHCAVTAARPVASVNSTEIVKDPSLNNFESQPSTVVAAEFSPFQDDVFATIAANQAITIYSLNQEAATRVIWADGGSVGLAWSPAQPFLLAVWGSAPTVTLYNTQTRENMGVLTTSEAQPKCHFSTAAFNAKSPRLFAVGSLDGTLRIWEVPAMFSNKPKNL